MTRAGDRQRLGRELAAADHRGIVAGDEFLNDLLGARTVGPRRVAQDQIDLGIAVLAVMLEHVEVDFALVGLAPFGVGAGKRRDDADRRMVGGMGRQIATFVQMATATTPAKKFRNHITSLLAPYFRPFGPAPFPVP